MRMRRALTLSLLLCAAAVLPAASGPRGGPALAAVRATTPAELRALARFDLAEARHGDEIDVVLWPGDAERLGRLGLRYRILVPDLDALDDAIRREDLGDAPGGPRTSYRHLADYEAEMRELDAGHGHVRLVEGPVRSLEGRTVYGLEIAAGVERVDGRPVVYFDGLHHAREWPAGELVMDFARELAEGFGTDERITSALKAVRVLLVPVVNVDGFHYSRESLLDQTSALGYVGEGGYWRKNRRGLAHPDGSSLASYGVDPNRNYAYQWGSGRVEWGASAVPVDQTYEGEGPFSEPEPRNVRHWFLTRHVVAANTNHTYSELVLWPWGYTYGQPPDGGALRALGVRMAATNGYRPMQSIGLYPTSGTSKDWAYGTLGTFAFTFEIGRQFHPPYDEVDELYDDNREAFMLLVEAGADASLHSLLTGTVQGEDGLAIPATVRLTKTIRIPTYLDGDGTAIGAPREVEETLDTSIQAHPDGSFEWHVNPSTRPEADAPETYDLTVSAPGYGSVSFPVTVSRGETRSLGTIVLRAAT